MKIDIEELIEIAREFDNVDPINWGVLNISEYDAYKLIALGLVEHFIDRNLNDSETQKIMLASMLKLTVETFVLNLRLSRYEG